MNKRKSKTRVPKCLPKPFIWNQEDKVFNYHNSKITSSSIFESSMRCTKDPVLIWTSEHLFIQSTLYWILCLNIKVSLILMFIVETLHTYWVNTHAKKKGPMWIKNIIWSLIWYKNQLRNIINQKQCEVLADLTVFFLNAPGILNLTFSFLFQLWRIFFFFFCFIPWTEKKEPEIEKESREGDRQREKGERRRIRFCFCFSWHYLEEG